MTSTGSESGYAVAAKSIIEVDDSHRRHRVSIALTNEMGYILRGAYGAQTDGWLGHRVTISVRRMVRIDPQTGEERVRVSFYTVTNLGCDVALRLNSTDARLDLSDGGRWQTRRLVQRSD